jgi:hypothetical protein
MRSVREQASPGTRRGRAPPGCRRTRREKLTLPVLAELLAAAEAEAVARGCVSMRSEVRRDNTASLALFRSNGYRQFDEVEDYYEDHMDALRFERTLAPQLELTSVRVPYYPQTTDFTCGPACLMMAMKALDPTASPRPPPRAATVARVDLDLHDLGPGRLRPLRARRRRPRPRLRRRALRQAARALPGRDRAAAGQEGGHPHRRGGLPGPHRRARHPGPPPPGALPGGAGAASRPAASRWSSSARGGSTRSASRTGW